MWGCAENNDTKQGKVNSFKVKYNGKIKNSQKWPIIPQRVNMLMSDD